MGVDEVEGEPVAQLERELAHVGVHLVDPAHERARVLRERRLADSVHEHAVSFLLHGQMAASAGEDVDLDPLAHQVLGELAHVARETALDHGRVLP